MGKKVLFCSFSMIQEKYRMYLHNYNIIIGIYIYRSIIIHCFNSSSSKPRACTEFFGGRDVFTMQRVVWRVFLAVFWPLAILGFHILSSEDFVKVVAHGKWLSRVRV